MVSRSVMGAANINTKTIGPCNAPSTRCTVRRRCIPEQQQQQQQSRWKWLPLLSGLRGLISASDATIALCYAHRWGCGSRLCIMFSCASNVRQSGFVVVESMWGRLWFVSIIKVSDYRWEAVASGEGSNGVVSFYWSEYSWHCHPETVDRIRADTGTSGFARWIQLNRMALRGVHFISTYFHHFSTVNRFSLYLFVLLTLILR